MGYVVRMHKAKKLVDDDEFSTRGVIPTMGEYRKGCSSMNLVKMSLLARRNTELWEIFCEFCPMRQVDNRNSVVGRDLDSLMDYTTTATIPLEEARRLRDRKRNGDPMYLRVCVCGTLWGQMCQG